MGVSISRSISCVRPDCLPRTASRCVRVPVALGSSEYHLTPQQEAERGGARSLFVVKDIAEGEELTAENIRSIRPGDGMPPAMTAEVLGRRAVRRLERGEPLRPGDFQ